MENTITKTKWAVDKSHSEVQFKVKHLVISTVTGTFNEFEGNAEVSDDAFSNADIHFKIDAKSIFTNNEDRDNHLKSADFFDIEKFDSIEFKGTNFEKIKGDQYKLTGHLTIKDVTKEVELDVEFGGIGKDPWGNIKAGFEVSGKINRKDFGLTWNAVTEAGGMLVGEDIKILINVQFVKG